ncbi:MAG: M20 family metallopeptidase [Desulfitobacteriaceae bacterium]
MTENTYFQEQELIDFLRDLIKIQSRSYEEQLIASYVEEYLKKCGAQTWSDNEGNVFGRIGQGNPVLLLHAHLDTVPEGEGWQDPPFDGVIHNNLMYGRGACDTKGGLAAMLMAFKQTATQKEKLRGTLLFAGVVREEISPPEKKGTFIALKNGLQADMAIVAEPTSLQACIAEIGRTEYILEIIGESAHANMPEQGRNSIVKMAEVVTDLVKRVKRPYSQLLGRTSTFNIGFIEGGIQSNIVPESCSILIDRGLVPGQNPEESLKEIRFIVESVLEGGEFRYRLSVPYQGFPATVDPQETVVQTLVESIRKHRNSNASPQGFVSHCDADWLITFGKIPSVIFGPGDLSVAHTNHEHVDLSEVQLAAKILIDTALDLLSVKTKS